MKSVVIALEILIILLIAALLLFVYSGWYNMAASEEHTGVTRWLIETTRTRSVRSHAEGIQVPPLERTSRDEGFRHFDAMCVLCHGAPGIGSSEIGEGLNPRPPDLVERVMAWTPAELFWIVRHGLKMTGMPAFGATHGEEELWAIVSFVRLLPEIAPEEYEQARRKAGSGHTPPALHDHGGGAAGEKEEGSGGGPPDSR